MMSSTHAGSAADAAVVTGKLAAEYGEMRERIALLEDRLAKASTESARMYLSILSLVKGRDMHLKIQALVNKMWDSKDLAWHLNGHMWLPSTCWLRIASFVSTAEKGNFAAAAACFGLPQPSLAGASLADHTTFGLFQSSCHIKSADGFSWLVIPEEGLVALAFTGSIFEIVPAVYRLGDEAAARDWADDGISVSFKCRQTDNYLVRDADNFIRPMPYANSLSYRLAASFRARNRGQKFEAFDLKGHFLSFAERHRSFAGRALSLSSSRTRRDGFRFEYVKLS